MATNDAYGAICIRCVRAVCLCIGLYAALCPVICCMSMHKDAPLARGLNGETAVDRFLDELQNMSRNAEHIAIIIVVDFVPIQSHFRSRRPQAQQPLYPVAHTATGPAQDVQDHTATGPAFRFRLFSSRFRLHPREPCASALATSECRKPWENAATGAHIGGRNTVFQSDSHAPTTSARQPAARRKCCAISVG